MTARRIFAVLAATLAAFTFALPASAAPSTAVRSTNPPVTIVPRAELPAHVAAAPGATVSPMDSTCYDVYTTDGGAMACFVPYGEHLWVCDEKADGHHPGVDYTYDSEPHSASYDLGAGNCEDIDLSLDEADSICYTAYNYEGSSWVSKSIRYCHTANG